MNDYQKTVIDSVFFDLTIFFSSLGNSLQAGSHFGIPLIMRFASS